MTDIPASNRALINQSARQYDGQSLPKPPKQFDPSKNPYDEDGAPGLATSYIDINCDCVKHIRKSRCDLMFQSFASCHNAVIRSMHRQRQKPMFFQCQGAYSRMNMCFQQNGLSGNLIDDNEQQSQQKELDAYQKQYKNKNNFSNTPLIYRRQDDDDRGNNNE